MARKIFINYRREDSIGTAGRLYDRLAQAFETNNLFMDVDHIPAGVDFVSYLSAQVAACDVFLTIIGPNWLDLRDESGGRRIDSPDDFVAIEIATALERNILVIPILIDGARMPKVNELPDALKPLARRQALELRHTQFGRDANALIAKVIASFGKSSFQLRVWQKAALVAMPMAAALLVGWIALYSMGGTSFWITETKNSATAPTDTKVVQPAALQAERERKAKADAEAEAKRKAEETERQRQATLQAEQERKAKADAEVEAEAKRKAEETERQRQATLQAEQERKAKADAEAEAEAKRKAEETERQRQATLQAEQERKAKADAEAEAEAKRKAEETERQRQATLQAEQERKAKADAEAEAKRKAEETERQRQATLQAEQERKAKADAEGGRGQAQG